MEFYCYSLSGYTESGYSPKIVPAKIKREWADESPTKHPYRCIPLAMGSSYGWELLSPCSFSVEFDGRFENPGNDSVKITVLDGYPYIDDVAHGWFGQGTVTFKVPFIFKTPQGYNTFVTGPLNSPKDGIYPMSAIVETDWLPFTFGMTWKMTRKGTAFFAKNEPFMRFFPMKRERMLEDCQVIVENIQNNDRLEKEYLAYSETKRKATEEGEKLDRFVPHTNYTEGVYPNVEGKGDIKAKDHYAKIILSPPIYK
jgi:hypothetical protein